MQATDDVKPEQKKKKLLILETRAPRSPGLEFESSDSALYT